MSGLGKVHKAGEVLWMVMLLLLLLAMGMMYLSSQQIQAIKINQWYDLSFRTEHAMDTIVADMIRSPAQRFQTSLPWGDIHHWPNEPLSSWQREPGAYHEFTSWGAEVHIVIEGNRAIKRLNALGFHPFGVILKKQCVIRCEETICRQLSCIIS